MAPETSSFLVIRIVQSTSTLRFSSSPEFSSSSIEDCTSAWASNAVTARRRSPYPGIAGSKDARNSSTCPALKSEAIVLSRSHTSSAESARNEAAAIPNSSMRLVSSGPVARIDSNIALGQVAGPEARTALSGPTDVDADLALFPSQLLLKFLFGEGRGQATPADRHILHIDVGFCRVERHTRIPCRAENSPPIRIRACDRRLHQRRIGDRPRNFRSAIVRFRARYHDGDQFRGSFAIARDCLREGFHHLRDRLLHLGQFLRIGPHA